MSKESNQTPRIDNPKELTLLQQARDIGMVCAFVGALAWWAFGLGEPYVERVIPVGTVEGIRYFGPLKIRTQVDTRTTLEVEATNGLHASAKQRSLAVSGITQFRKGQEVVLIVRRFDVELCSLDVFICERVYGSPE